MDMIGLDAEIVRGSHGRLPTPGREDAEAPIFVSLPGTSKQIRFR